MRSTTSSPSRAGGSPWSEIDAGGPAPARASHGVLARIVPPVVVVAILVLLDRITLAVIVAVLSTALLVATAVSPAVERGFARVVAFIGHWVGRGLSLVLLGLIEVFVVFPVWLVGRFFSVAPLGPEVSGIDRWTGRNAAVERLRHRAFGHERFRAPTAVRPRSRWRTVARVVLVLLVLDLVVGAGVNRVVTSRRQANNFGYHVSGVFDDDPWAPQMFEETYRVSILDPYRPFLEWDQEDVEGRYVNVEDGMRRSYVAAAPAGIEPVDVWFFGGSSLVGYGQRDDHTIPSEVVRLAEQDGIPIRAHNFGVAGYVQWQGLLKLEQLLVDAEEPPDVVVFYDGWNDLDAQIQDPRPGLAHKYTEVLEDRLNGATSGDSGLDEWATIRRAYLLRSLTMQVSRTVNGWIQGDDEVPRELRLDVFPAEERATWATDNLRRGVELAGRLGTAYGFEPVLFWQPYLESSDGQLPQDDLIEEIPGYDTSRPVWTRLTEEAHERLPDQMVDLSEALDGLDEPVFYDQVHTNEAGAAAIAEAMYAALRPRLSAAAG